MLNFRWDRRSLHWHEHLEPGGDCLLGVRLHHKDHSQEKINNGAESRIKERTKTMMTKDEEEETWEQLSGPSAVVEDSATTLRMYYLFMCFQITNLIVKDKY